MLKVKERYGLTYGELVEECKTNKTYLCLTLKGKKQGALISLGRIFDVLQCEKENEKFRNKLVKTSISKDKWRKYD